MTSLLPVWLAVALVCGVAPSGIPALEDALGQEAAAVPLKKMHDKGLLSDEEYLAALQEVDAKRFKLPFKLEAAPGWGMTVGTLDDRFSLNIKTRVATRAVLAFTTQPSPLDGPSLASSAATTARASTLDVQLKTLRLYFSGNVLSRDLKYAVQLAFAASEFEPGNPSPVLDAFMEYTRFRDANVRVGQFFVPFDRARTIREFSLQFVDRQQVIQELTLDRDVGVELSSKDLLGLGGWVSYNLFLGSGEGRNRILSVVPGLLSTARITIRPFGAFDDDSEGDLERSFKPRLAVGAAVAFNHSAVRSRGTTGTAFQLGSFNHVHAVVDTVLKFGGFSLLAEALLRTTPQPILNWQQVHEGEVGGVKTREWSRSGAGLLVQGGMMLTNNLEITGRFDRLWALPNTDPALVKLAQEQGTELGTGVNVYLHGHRLKLQGDYQVQLADNAPNPARHVTRVHLDGMF